MEVVTFIIKSTEEKQTLCIQVLPKKSFDSCETALSAEYIREVEKEEAQYLVKDCYLESLRELVASSLTIEDFDSFLAVEQMNLSNVETKEGSIEFQKLATLLNKQDLRLIFLKWADSLVELAYAKFANYAVLGIVERLEEYERFFFISKIQSSIVKMAVHSKASIIIQELIKRASENEAALFMQAFEHKILKLVKNSYGCYCIQYLIARLDEKHRNSLFLVLFENIDKLIFNKKQYVLVNEALNYEIDEETAKIGISIILDKKELFKNSENEENLNALLCHMKCSF